jgi:hypothetical protein
MNVNGNHRPLLSVMAGAFLAIAAWTPAHAADCNTPRGVGEQRACAAAAEGVETLRRFVERTRMVYGLLVRDFEKGLPPERTVGDDEKTRVAEKQ